MRKKIYPLIVGTALYCAQAISSFAHADVMLGASVLHDGWSRASISEFNDVVPVDLAYVNVFSGFSHDWDNLYWQASNVVAEGAMPMISWMPVDLSRRQDNLLPEIVLGQWDDYITLWGTRLKGWIELYPETDRPRVAIRFAHEFNGNWYPYSNTPASFIAAWQHIHDKFTQIGVNEYVDWIWSANFVSIDDYDDFTAYYPGDEFVDWTSLDGYNWGSNYSFSSWSSFKEVFTNSYLTLVNNYPEKPILIAEVASTEPVELPNPDWGQTGDNSDANESKTVWIEEMLADIESEFPAIKALTLFNLNKELSWSMTEPTSTGLDGWIAGMGSNHYVSEYLVAPSVASVAPLYTDEVMQSVSYEIASADTSKSTPAKGAKASKGSKANANSVGASVFEAAESRVVGPDRKTLIQQRVLDSKLLEREAKLNKPNQQDRTKELALAKGFRGMKTNNGSKFANMKLSVIEK